MPKAAPNAHLTAADEAISMLADATQFIEASIEAHSAITDSKSSRLTPKLKAVSDSLPAVLGLLQDIHKQFSAKMKLDEAVSLAAENDILECHDACRELKKVLEGAYIRIRTEGANEADRLNLDKFLTLKGKRAVELLNTVHGSMKGLESLEFVTGVCLLEDIGNTLTSLTEGRN
jgi:hypothetical protein